VIFTEKGTLRAGSLEKVIEWVCSKPLTANTNRNVNVSPFPILSVRSYNTNESLVSLTLCGSLQALVRQGCIPAMLPPVLLARAAA
jgi:hypothetical protein